MRLRGVRRWYASRTEPGAQLASPYAWAMGVALIMLAVAYFGWTSYGANSETQTQARLGALESDRLRLEQDNAGMKSELAVLQRQLQIERASAIDLTKQLRSLSDENAKLREELAVVQAIAGRDGKAEGLKLGSVRIEPLGGAGEYSYRIVLLQTGPLARPFQGSYQLVISTVQDGARRGVTLPAAAARSEPPYRLDFKQQQRVEGTFKVDPNAVVRSVQVRVFEAGQAQPRIMQTVTLS